MGRTLVIGDIHGGLKGLEQLLDRAMVTTEDHLIFLGDYVDGWGESSAVVSLLITLSRKQKTTLLRGNHDDLVCQWLDGAPINPMWMRHGGQSTIDSYEALTQTEKAEHLQFYSNLEDYYIDKKNRMFCHAGFQNINGPEYEWHNTAFYWDRTLWETACAVGNDPLPEDILYPKRLLLFKEIYIGHTPVTRIGHTVPVQKANVWNLDTGAAFKGTISLMDIDTKQVWQSDPIWKLYPDEKGRN